MFFIAQNLLKTEKNSRFILRRGTGGSSRRHILAEKDYIQRLHKATMETFYGQQQAGLLPTLYRGGFCRGAYDRDYCR